MIDTIDRLPVACFHPAEYLVDELLACQMTTRDLAALFGGEIEVETLALNLYIAAWLSDNPDHNLNVRCGDLPEKLEKAWDVSAQMWNDLEVRFLDLMAKGVPMGRCEETVQQAESVFG